MTTLKIALAATLAVGAITAIPAAASAQPGWDRHHERMEYRHERRMERRHERMEHHRVHRVTVCRNVRFHHHWVRRCHVEARRGW